MKNPYRRYIRGLVRQMRRAENMAVQTPKQAPLDRPSNRRGVLFICPHPDDECITGGLPLRFMRENGLPVTVLCVTLGSRKDRRSTRRAELHRACQYLGFDVIVSGEKGLEQIKPETRKHQPGLWRSAVAEVLTVLKEVHPGLVFYPHEADWNSTHMGVHLLAEDALREMPEDFRCPVIETEYWGAMSNPDLMVESGPEDVADLVAALSLHAGEMRRNPFHLRLPAWMIDNVRRGNELVGGQGGEGAPYVFATLYRLSIWKSGRKHRALKQGRMISAAEDPARVLLAQE